MRALAFAYHTLGVVGLDALMRHGYDLAAVYSHDDNPDEEIWFDSVVEFCKKNRLDVFCPTDISNPKTIEIIRKLSPDIIFSFYYRHMIPVAILDIPPKGSLNLHGSLLPKYRGRCPVNWAILNGENETGVTLHYMVEKPDAGEIVGQKAVDINIEDTALTVYRKLEQAAAVLLDELLPKIKDGTHPRFPNPIGKGSYFSGRRPEDGKIDWRRNAKEIYNLIRAVTHPYPGAFGDLRGEKILVWWARPSDREISLTPGQVRIHDGKVFVGTGSGNLVLEEVLYREDTLTGDELISRLMPFNGEVIK